MIFSVEDYYTIDTEKRKAVDLWLDSKGLDKNLVYLVTTESNAPLSVVCYISVDKDSWSTFVPNVIEFDIDDFPWQMLL